MIKQQHILKLTMWQCLLLICLSGFPFSCYAQNQNSTEQTPSSFFQIKQDTDGKYWFMDPKGDQFLSIGINNIIPEPFRPKPNTKYFCQCLKLLKLMFWQKLKKARLKMKLLLIYQLPKLMIIWTIVGALSILKKYAEQFIRVLRINLKNHNTNWTNRFWFLS